MAAPSSFAKSTAPTDIEPVHLLEHLFRRQAGRMVSHLARLLGPAQLSLAEECVQEAMLRALASWPYDGVPANPEGWLYRVAHNVAIDSVRRARLAGIKTEAVVLELTRSASRPEEDPGKEQSLRDDELAMIFMCCHPEIPVESQVALSLKTVGGFSVREIARAFLSEDATIAQRLVRAKRQVRERSLTLEMPSGAELDERLDSVLAVLYFLFNEGYSAHEGEDLIRIDLCQEALRLGQLITSSNLVRPKVHALIALMALQTARSNARVDAAGDLILLEDQDPERWDARLTHLGFSHFDRSIAGREVTRYHVEAAIAAAHARAVPGRVPLDWEAILELYDHLLEIDPASPVVALNRAVAVAKLRGPAAGLAAIERLESDPKLRGYHLLLAVRGHFLLELRCVAEAAACFEAALNCRCTEPERRFLQRKLNLCRQAS